MFSQAFVILYNRGRLHPGCTSLDAPPWMHPPTDALPPPARKQTVNWLIGTYPTGMHSCLQSISITFSQLRFSMVWQLGLEWLTVDKLIFFYLKIFGGTSVIFVRSLITPVLDISCHLPWGFEARVDPLLTCFVQCIPQIRVWCDICWPLGCLLLNDSHFKIGKC